MHVRSSRQHVATPSVRDVQLMACVAVATLFDTHRHLAGDLDTPDAGRGGVACLAIGRHISALGGGVGGKPM